MEDERLSIYRASRTIKRKANSLYNALRSIYDDSIFVGEIAQLWPDLPLLANLRCGLWYFPKFHSSCYFKSTDGHSNNWSFNTSRLNLHVAQLAEKALIEYRLEPWTKELETSGADIASLASALKKPLRPLWISQKTVIWLNEVPESDSWDFTPIILVSASSLSGIFQQRTTSEFSWNYISGAGDDEESWARGLSPDLFWNHVYDLINSDPDLCNQRVADIVEKDRVYRAQRGQNAPQVSIKSSKLSGSTGHFSAEEPPLYFEIPGIESDQKSFSDDCTISWIGSTNLAVGATRLAVDVSNVDSILNCDRESVSLCLENPGAYLHLPIVNSKLDRFSLLGNLPSALNFAKLNLRNGKRLLVCCNNGEDISVCVCLAILTSLFNNEGSFDDGKSFSGTHITKLEMRRQLVYICKFAVNARPSRGNLKQVFNFLNGGSVGSVS